MMNTLKEIWSDNSSDKDLIIDSYKRQLVFLLLEGYPRFLTWEGIELIFNKDSIDIYYDSIIVRKYLKDVDEKDKDMVCYFEQRPYRELSAWRVREINTLLPHLEFSS